MWHMVNIIMMWWWWWCCWCCDGWYDAMTLIVIIIIMTEKKKGGDSCWLIFNVFFFFHSLFPSSWFNYNYMKKTKECYGNGNLYDFCKFLLCPSTHPPFLFTYIHIRGELLIFWDRFFVLFWGNKEMGIEDWLREMGRKESRLVG